MERMKDMDILGNGRELFRRDTHPYLGAEDVLDEARRGDYLEQLNRNRANSRTDAVEITYYYEVANPGEPGQGLLQAARMVLEHGTLKPWEDEGDRRGRKPARYDEYMSWATDIRLLGYNRRAGVESGLLTIAYPTLFFDKREDNRFPLAQWLMAVASEPFSAFSFYQAARVVDARFPPSLWRKFPGQRWPHRRIRQYLGMSGAEPLIGTIVKPKTGLTPGLFARSVVEAALAGARFTKADENMHLSLRQVPRYVSRVVRDLERAGFDLGRDPQPGGRRFLFAPHITTDADQIQTYAQAALEAGANALMFSPYYSGGFQGMAEVVERFDVPVYAHTAGMNVFGGSSTWGISSHLLYLLAAVFGAAFMQNTTVNGYLRPDDTEKVKILSCLRENRLLGDQGMTLAVAGGLGPHNIGTNLAVLGEEGRMLLAGSSVYGHPDGPRAGVEALLLAHRAYREEHLTEKEALQAYALRLGPGGRALLAALM